MYIPAELRASEPVLQTVQKIYTTHAGGKDVRLLPELLKRLDAALIDIRLAPPVHPIGWNKDYLKLLLKGRYRHVPSLGARIIGTEKFVIQNLGLGIKIITELQINLILFCACENEKECHRRLISEELIKQGREVTEIEGWN